MQYYEDNIYIPHVDEHDEYIDKVERWEAHEKSILHRAFTVGLLYQDQMICQHRKHPVFDGWLDLTASSHPQVFDDGAVQPIEEAIYQTLQREWQIDPKEIHDLHSSGYVVYESPDPHGAYIEHEVCHLYLGTIERIPSPQNGVAYGYTLQTIKRLGDTSNPVNSALAPWVDEFFKSGLLK